VVFPDHRAVLGLDALAGHARAHHFGQAVDVDGVDAELALDLGAHALPHGSAPKMPTLSEISSGLMPRRSNSSAITSSRTA
jgi:hypothetical protein